MRARISIKSYCIILDDNKISVEGPDKEACTDIAERFLDYIKLDGSGELLAQYVRLHDEIAEKLEIPTSSVVEYPALDNLHDWLQQHTEMVSAVEEALIPFGYKKPETQPAL